MSLNHNNGTLHVNMAGSVSRAFRGDCHSRGREFYFVARVKIRDVCSRGARVGSKWLVSAFGANRVPVG
jgi:hypothetical protein